MTTTEIVEQLKVLGSDGYKHVLRKYGIPEPFYGVKIEEMKKIQSKVKKDYQLALDLYATGIYDAMYLAGLIADDGKMTKGDLRGWLSNAKCDMLREYTVPWVASESNHGRELAMEWIDSVDENEMAAGWSTLSSLVSIKDDSELDMDELRSLLLRVRDTIHQQPNRVRRAMNGLIIAVGSYVKDLTVTCLDIGNQIGRVKVDMGGTACKVPFAPEQIEKVRQRGSIGKKRKTAKC